MSVRAYIFTALFVCLQATSAFCQPVAWTNTGTGLTAGDWSVASNWNPAMVPTSLNNAQIGNGGEARLSTGIATSRIEVGKNGGSGIFTSEAAAINIVVNSDFDIGEIGGGFATGPVVVTGNGSATISNAALLLVGNSGAGDLDIGQTNATLGAQASGVGTLSLNGVTQVTIVDDADVGQAGGTANATANGTLLVSSVGTLQIGADFDIGQSGGSGQAHATGMSDIQNTSVIVGSDVDVGRTTSSIAGNSGDGILTLSDSTLSIGFADILSPGSLNIGDAGASLSQLANGLGAVTLVRTTADVADRINIGGLSGGGTNGLNSSNGSLTVIDSLVEASKVDVALVASNTAGTATGLLRLNPSLLDISGTLILGGGSTLAIELAGPTRADGTGSVGQYSAIDAAVATLGGSLEISLGDDFVPSLGDVFNVVNTTVTLGGIFRDMSLPNNLPSGLSWNVLQTANQFQLEVQSDIFDGDFDADGDVDGSDFLTWQRGLGILTGASKTQGDADLDGDVDPIDLFVWKSTFGSFVSASLSSDLVPSVAVPQPTSLTLLAWAMVTLGGLRRQQRRGHCKCPSGREFEQ